MFVPKLLLSTLLAGAAAAPRPGVPSIGAIKVRGKSYVSVQVMTRRRGLRLAVNERAGIYTLLDGGHRVVIVPGFSVAEVDGRTVDLPYPAIFHRDELLVPSMLFLRARRSFERPASKTIPLRKVVLDPGHGGRDSGAVGAGGIREKDVTLSVALRLKRLLERRGVSVVITRSTDKYLSLAQRSRVANSSGADLFLSIHCNAARSSAAKGLETFALSWGISDSHRAGKAAVRHSPGDLVSGSADRVSASTEKTIMRAHLGEQRKQSIALSKCLQAEMVRLLGELDRGVKLRNFSVLRETYIPAALVEVGFVSYAPTARKMRTSSHRQRIAEALEGGIARFGRNHKLQLDRIAGKAAPGADPTPRYALGSPPASRTSTASARRRTASRSRTPSRRGRTRTAGRSSSRSSRSRRYRTLSASRHTVAYRSRRRRR